MQELQRAYALEQDSGKKREILEQILALIQAGWEQLFTSLSKEENPQQVLLLVADLNRVFEERRAQLKKPQMP